jgi:hypothetical protein
MLVGALILREPRLRRIDDIVLSFFLQNSASALPAAPVTLVEIGRDDILRLAPAEKVKPLPKGEAARRSLSPLEYALFLQAVLDFNPPVIAIEPMLIWPERDRIQKQIFLDQAMHVPKLLVALELGAKGQHDLTTDDLPTLPNITGNRTSLTQFVGVSRQPDEEIRLVSTPGFVNLPNDQINGLRVPLVFEYRGEVVPAFTLQAIMLWLRLTPADVKVELGSKIVLPNGWQIPLRRDGTITINPAAIGSIQHLSLGELLFAAEEKDHHRQKSPKTDNLNQQIVLLRVAEDPLQPPNVFSTAIATIQDNAWIRPASEAVAWITVLLVALLAGFIWIISKTDFFLGAALFSAGYAMTALDVLTQRHLWLPTFPPLALICFLVVIRLLGERRQKDFSPKAAG